MRILLVVIWTLIPVGALAYHLGPGQKQMKLDQASLHSIAGDAEAQAGDWQAAQECYENALGVLPASRVAASQKLRLERAKAMMNNRGLVEANQELESLVAELEQDKVADSSVLAEARSALANSQFYRTWLMRLEGQPREIWEAQIESAQQTYRMLAQDSENSGDDVQFVRHTEDLESAIKLARMDLGDLQGLPLPNQ